MFVIPSLNGLSKHTGKEWKENNVVSIRCKRSALIDFLQLKNDNGTIDHAIMPFTPIKFPD